MGFGCTPLWASQSASEEKTSELGHQICSWHIQLDQRISESSGNGIWFSIGMYIKQNFWKKNRADVICFHLLLFERLLVGVLNNG